MTTPRIEEMVAKYTKVIHPQDLGEETNKLENTLRQALTEAHQAGIDEAVEEYRKSIDSINGSVAQAYKTIKSYKSTNDT